MTVPVRTPFSRVFTHEGRAGPLVVPVYQGQARAMGPSQGFGDRTPIREPSGDRYGAFKTIDAIKAERDLPTMSLENRFPYTRSEFLRMAQVGCPLDVQVHIGQCGDPRDYNGGWRDGKVLVLEGADFSNWSTGDLGALEQGDDAVVNETMDLNGLELFEIKPLALAEVAAAEILGEVIAVSICDSITCGICGIPSDGCQRMFAITETQLGSPGLPAELIYSSDSGATIGETNVLTLLLTQDPSDMACVGTLLVIVSNDSCSLHYAPIADILVGGEIWAEQAAGFECPNGEPNAIWSRGSRFTWIVGDGGYIYFSSDIPNGVVVQDAGVATAEVLLDVHAFDDLNVVAVGEDNAVVRTENGGETWVAVTGPTGLGIDLYCVWMRSAEEWLIGDSNGGLWFTRDGGTIWDAIESPALPPAGEIRDIYFSNPTVGYIAHTLAGVGRILRTISGGNSWYVLPEGTGEIPANQRINSLAPCVEDPNIVFAGGLGVGNDGILVKGA